jgi:hypothetical protein
MIFLEPSPARIASLEPVKGKMNQAGYDMVKPATIMGTAGHDPAGVDLVLVGPKAAVHGSIRILLSRPLPRDCRP